jgi:hypothetical protein
MAMDCIRIPKVANCIITVVSDLNKDFKIKLNFKDLRKKHKSKENFLQRDVEKKLIAKLAAQKLLNGSVFYNTQVVNNQIYDSGRW